MMSAPIEALTGWFQLGWSDTVPPGELVSVTVLGHGLVARRTLAGNLVVTDAHCPHLGAHLGMGCAVGDGLRLHPEARSILNFVATPLSAERARALPGWDR